MSGTVPPPPPPGPAPQGPGDESRAPARTSALPPSFAPGSPQGASSPSAASPSAPPAASPSAASPGAAPTAVHQPVGQTQQYQPQPQTQQYTAPNRQPAYQQTAYQQPAHQPAPQHQPPAQQPPAYQQYGYTPQQYAYQQPAGAQPTAGGTAQSPAVAPSAKRGKKKLSPGWIAFIVADVVLIIVAVVFAFQVLGGSDLPSVDAGSDPEVVAPQDTEEDAEDGEGAGAEAIDPGASVAAFGSPSRNIACEIFENQVTCQIAELNQQPAPVDGCDGTTGYVVTLDDAGQVALPCVPSSDTPQQASGSLDQLGYGESTTEGDFTCRSEQDGMFCQHDPSGNGFSLARAGVGTY